MATDLILIDGQSLPLNDLNELIEPFFLSADRMRPFEQSEASAHSQEDSMLFGRETASTSSSNRPEPAASPQSSSSKLNTSWSNTQSKLQQALLKKILGQSAANQHITRAFLTADLLQIRGHGPRAALLFVGPSGTGKRYAAETLAESLGGNYKFLSLDLSQIAHHNQTDLLTGSEPSFQEAAPGLLTSYVAQHPETVVFLENIERCHPLVLARLNKLLDTGRLKDQFGITENGLPKKGSLYETNFSKAVLVFSTCAGEQTYTDPAFLTALREQPTHAEAMLLDTLSKVSASIAKEGPTLQFTSEMIHHWRGGRTILFQELDLEALVEIGRRSLLAQAADIHQRLGIEVQGINTIGIVEAMLLTFAPRVAAEAASKGLGTLLFSKLFEEVLNNRFNPKKVTVMLSPAAQNQWLEFHTRLTAGKSHVNVIQEVKRRGLKLGIRWNLLADGSLFLADELTVEQVQSPDDLQGAGAIRVEVPKVGFDDIAGHMLIKQRLAEVVKLLRHEHNPKVRKIIPRGLLMYGPPGTGKTLLARALAHEADLPFINTTGSELLDAEFTRNLFARARRYAPTLVFIDEIDALGSRSNANYRSQVQAINQLLTELDGFDGNSQGMVFVVAATNLPNDVDPALRRPGRLDLHVEVPPLDPPARGFFVDRILSMPAKDDVKRDDLIRLTAGMTGAQLEKLHRELQLAQLRSKGQALTNAMVLETVNTIMYGERSVRPLSEDFMRNTAIHEAGHAVIQKVVNPDQKISHINITPRGYLAGFVKSDVESMHSHRYTLIEVMDQLCVLLAGRNAQEKLCPGSADDGAQSDLAKATELALAAVGRWGLSTDYGVLALGNDLHSALHQAAAPELLNTARKLLADADARCRELIDLHWSRIVALQERLLEEECIIGEGW